MTYEDYLVVGNSDGTIRFYDFCFKVVAWLSTQRANTTRNRRV